MKIYKIFENNKPSKFEIGDIVYVINARNTNLKLNIQYEIKNITYNKNQDEYQYTLTNMPILFRYFEHRFISEEEHAVKKYNL